MRVRTWDSLPQAKYCKNRLKGYTFFGQIYTKNYLFLLSPHFKSYNGYIWQEGAGLEVAPHAKFRRNRLRDIPFGGTLY